MMFTANLNPKVHIIPLVQITYYWLNMTTQKFIAPSNVGHGMTAQTIFDPDFDLLHTRKQKRYLRAMLSNKEGQLWCVKFVYI